MLNLKLIQKNVEYVIEKLELRGVDKELLQKLSKLISKRNNLLFQLSKAQEEKNLISAKISKEKNKELFKQASIIKTKVQELESEVNDIQNTLDELLPQIPNIPLDDVPFGNDEKDNKVISQYKNLGRGLVGTKKPHYEIAAEKDIVDFVRGAKLSGSRFAIFKGLGAKLIRSLESFMLDVHTKNGYEEFFPPVLVNTEMLFGTGQLPKFKDDLFKIENDNL